MALQLRIVQGFVLLDHIEGPPDESLELSGGGVVVFGSIPELPGIDHGGIGAADQVVGVGVGDSDSQIVSAAGQQKQGHQKKQKGFPQVHGIAPFCGWASASLSHIPGKNARKIRRAGKRSAGWGHWFSRWK